MCNTQTLFKQFVLHSLLCQKLLTGLKWPLLCLFRGHEIYKGILLVVFVKKQATPCLSGSAADSLIAKFFLCITVWSY